MAARALPPFFNDDYNEGCTGASIPSSNLRRSNRSLYSGIPDTMNPSK